MIKRKRESILKSDIKRYLTLRGWFVFNIMQGLGAYKGISDLIAINHGHVVFIELKTDDKRSVQSENQIKFQQGIESHEGHYIIMRNLDDCIGFVNKFVEMKNYCDAWKVK